MEQQVQWLYIVSIKIFRLNDECDSIRSDFQAGVNTLYNKCVSCGVTPSSKTPTAIGNSIHSIYNNRYNAGVSATKKGNATVGNVLSGKTFTSTAGVNLTGTMPNRGNLNWSASNTTKTVSAGYYSGGTLDSRPSYNAGYNAGVAASNPSANLVYSVAGAGTKDYTYTTTAKGICIVTLAGVNTGTRYCQKNGSNQTPTKQYDTSGRMLFEYIISVNKGDKIRAYISITEDGNWNSGMVSIYMID